MRPGMAVLPRPTGMYSTKATPNHNTYNVAFLRDISTGSNKVALRRTSSVKTSTIPKILST